MTAPRPEDREIVKGPETADGNGLAGLSPAIRAYLAHIEGGLGIRAIARIRGCPPSTILRQVRRVEARRDDGLVDAALARLAVSVSSHFNADPRAEDWAPMIACELPANDQQDEKIKREARRILRRLCEKDAFLAVAADMDNAVVLREAVPGRHTRTAVVERDVAHRFALLDWIGCESAGRVARYTVTEAGRAALKRLLEEDRRSRARAEGVAENVTPFRAQHQEFAERRIMASDGSGEAKIRYNLAESPLTVLGRKRDRDGTPFLSPDQVIAGERLREDFELAQMGPRVTQNWDAFLAPCDTGPAVGRGPAEGPQAARARVQAAMAALGPGLSDVVFRVCCFLEGLEAAEKRLGWSARSGKVVLRIALQRLAMHYGMHPSAGSEGARRN